MTAKEFLENEYNTTLDKINVEGTHAEWCMIEFAREVLEFYMENVESNIDDCINDAYKETIKTKLKS